MQSDFRLSSQSTMWSTIFFSLHIKVSTMFTPNNNKKRCQINFKIGVKTLMIFSENNIDWSLFEVRRISHSDSFSSYGINETAYKLTKKKTDWFTMDIFSKMNRTHNKRLTYGRTKYFRRSLFTGFYSCETILLHIILRNLSLEKRCYLSDDQISMVEHV